jgi:hypothetical protein
MSPIAGNIKLRVMKNQDGPPDPDMVLSRGMDGLWQIGLADISALLAEAEQQPDYGATLLRLITSYYERGMSISTSFAPNASTGIFATLRNDPDFPRGLSKRKTDALVRELQRNGALVSETYKKPNRATAGRWLVVGPPTAKG